MWSIIQIQTASKVTWPDKSEITSPSRRKILSVVTSKQEIYLPTRIPTYSYPVRVSTASRYQEAGFVGIAVGSSKAAVGRVDHCGSERRGRGLFASSLKTLARRPWLGYGAHFSLVTPHFLVESHRVISSSGYYHLLAERSFSTLKLALSAVTQATQSTVRWMSVKLASVRLKCVSILIIIIIIIEVLLQNGFIYLYVFKLPLL